MYQVPFVSNTREIVEKEKRDGDKMRRKTKKEHVSKDFLNENLIE